MDRVFEAVNRIARDVPAPVAVDRLGKHVALLLHLVEQGEQRPIPAAADGFLRNEEIGVHHLHTEADAEHGLAGSGRVFHDLKMIGIEARAAAEDERVAERQCLRNDRAVAAEDADRRAAAGGDALRIAVDK